MNVGLLVVHAAADDGEVKIILESRKQDAGRKRLIQAISDRQEQKSYLNK